MTLRSVLVLSIAATLGLDAAVAAQGAWIDGDEVEIRDAPNPSARVLARMKRGSGVAASTIPTLGYHKIRTHSGVLGWVSGASLIFKDPRKEPIGNKAPVPAPMAPDPDIETGPTANAAPMAAPMPDEELP